MKSKNVIKLILSCIVISQLFGCVSIKKHPVLADIDPEYFEDTNVKIDFIIGIKVYYLRIENKTDSVIKLRHGSIISISGEAKNLNLSADDDLIPPNSTVVYRGNQDTIFETDVTSQFTDNPPPINIGDEILNAIKGSSIRIFLIITINDITEVYDINIKIEGIKT